jgi:hypothetical protein
LVAKLCSLIVFVNILLELNGPHESVSGQSD